MKQIKDCTMRKNQRWYYQQDQKYYYGKDPVQYGKYPR